MSKRVIKVTDEIRAELERVRIENGGYLKPEDVVKAARKRNSPLWHYYNSMGLWNKDKAQELALLLVARGLVMRIRVNIQTNDAPPIRVRAYFSDKEDRVEGKGYQSVVEVMHSDDGRAAMLRTARAELESIARKYRALEELSTVIAAIDDLGDADAA